MSTLRTQKRAGATTSSRAVSSRTVRLGGVPVDLFIRAEQHTEDLVRELWLMVLSEARPRSTPRYRELVHAADSFVRSGAPLRNGLLATVVEARDAGLEVVDLELHVPANSGKVAREFETLLDQMDELCDTGDLLTLGADAEVRTFRHWYASEIERQVGDGLEPVSWHHYASDMLISGL